MEAITPRWLAHTRILPGTRLAAERVGGTDSRLGRPVGEQDSPNDAPGTPVALISSLALQRRQLEVMVLVKATPQPSTKYGDTVCVAGALLGQGPVRWIRLYPIPFRYLESAAKFRKYQTVKVELRPTSGDYRPESAKVNLEQIVGGPVADDWKHRAPIVEQLAGPSMCELLAGVTANQNATSLGAVRPRDVDGLDFEEHGPWSVDQLRKMQSVADQDALLGSTEAKQVVLQPPRFKVWLRWRCESPRCPGHRMRILDWELTALQAKYGRTG